MRAFSRLVVFCLIATTLMIGTASGVEPTFQRQEIDGDIQIGYGLSVGRVDDDPHVDVLLADRREIVWYKNPGAAGEPWAKHVMARELTPRDNVCIAARDVDGDGLVEVAVGANWNPGETSDAAQSGALFYLKRPSEPTQRWDAIPMTPHDPTTHRMHWLKCRDGQVRLAVLPLHGVGNSDGAGRTVLVSLYQVSDGVPRLFDKLDTMMHMTHNFELVADSTGSESMLIAGKEGYVELDSEGGANLLVDGSVSPGAGEVRRYDPTSGAFAGIEPMHGSDVALYQSGDDGVWRRRVLDTSLNAGHALAAADLCGDETQEVVAGWRSPNEQGRVGVKIYVPAGEQWQSYLIDDNKIACEDLKLCDFDSDGMFDMVAAGRASANVVVYWNRSE